MAVRSLHWGKVEEAVAGYSSLLTDALVQLETKKIVPAERSCLVLTTKGAVYSIDSANAGSTDFAPVVRD